MNKVNDIINNKRYTIAVSEIEKAEEERIFCKHDMAHFLSVARLMEIENCKEALGIDEEVIYATALLHDIGRYVEYKDGTPHEEASYKLSKLVLNETKYSEEEKQDIVEAILSHRNENKKTEKSLSGLLYRGDKKSRACFCCKAREECNWPDSKKNLQL